MRSAAREAFLARMNALEKASQSNDLQAHAFVAADGDPSRLLRNGLTVVGFAAFEEFFAVRSKEILERIDPAKVPFGSLPQKLQAASTYGAIQTLTFRARLDKDVASRLALIQDHAAYLASTSTGVYKLSPLSFAPQGSNVGAQDIEEAMKALGVEAPWTEMTRLASRVGYGVPGLADIFKSSAGNRHLAAHLATADIGLADVQELPTKFRVVALTIDALMARAVVELPAAIAARQAKLLSLSSRVHLRFVDHAGGKYRVIKEKATRADRIFNDSPTALAHSLPISEKAGATLVVRDHRNLPIEWYTP